MGILYLSIPIFIRLGYGKYGDVKIKKGYVSSHLLRAYTERGRHARTNRAQTKGGILAPHHELVLFVDGLGPLHSKFYVI